MKTNLPLGLISGFILGLSACSADDGLLEVTAADTNTPDAEDPVPVELHFRFCGESAGRDLSCAELEVPLDYDAPDGETLPIAINRMLANPNEPYRGVLLFNPGGPGASGKEIAQLLHGFGYFDALAPGYDIIGFDPRGVAESGARSCGFVPEPQMDMGEMAPVQQFGMQAFVDVIASEGRRCESAWGPLFRELGSKQVVRDMDAIRRALGEDKLNFLGISYGTRLGSLYAHTFPETTGAIVLDAPVDPELNILEQTRIEFRQTLKLHEAVFADCASGRLVCPAEPRRLFEEMIDDADALGVASDVLLFWTDSLSQAAARDALPGLLQMQLAEPDSEWLLEIAASAGTPGIGYVVNFGVNCTDSTVEPASVAELDALFAELMAENQHFASQALQAAVCTGWPVTRDPVPLPSATEAPPLLVIGGTQDLRTPYAYAEAMTEALGNATLLTSNHYGHGATPQGGDCIIEAVRGFFTGSALPPYGAACP